MPVLLITSPQDHVVDPPTASISPARTAATVEHVWLERSYHVATQDYDRDRIVADGGHAFVKQVAS